MQQIRPIFIAILYLNIFSGFDMSPQLLLSQAADLERPPTQEEVEAELATPGKSGRVRSSSSRGPGTNGREGDKALAKVQNEMLTFRGELDIMKSMMAQLLQNSQKQKTGDVEPPASSDVGTDVIQMISEKVAPALSQVLAPLSNIRASLITQRSISSRNTIN
jgi:hypothetical protein